MNGLLAWFKFDALTQPGWLWLLPVALLLFLLECSARPYGAIRVSTARILARECNKIPRWRMRIPAFLRMVGLSLLLLALAGPMNGFEVRKDRANVVDIMLCVDVSGSMGQQDFKLGGERRNRLFVTKRAVRDFIANRKDKDEDRYGLDRVGLILYAGYPWTQSPLTLDYYIVERELDGAKIMRDRKKDGTAIGSAIGLAVRRLSKSEAKSKVIILLTDGLNNKGELDPITAAQIAKKFGIRVYTIGAGTTDGGARGMGLFMQKSQPIDEEMLRNIANTTGAKYYRVTDTESLRQAYAEIDQLESTEIEIGDYYEYKDAFLPYAVWSAILLLASAFIRRRWFEPIP